MLHIRRRKWLEEPTEQIIISQLELTHFGTHLSLEFAAFLINLSPTMKLIAKKAFPNATIVSDRFHVQKLINEAISDLRVDYRWQAIDQENAKIALAKEVKRPFVLSATPF